MIAIAHMAAGIAGGAVLLILFPKIIPKLLKNDTFFLIASGIWAMIPDLHQIGINIPHGGGWQNIFWFHTLLDNYPDTPIMAAYALAIMLAALYLYRRKL